MDQEQEENLTYALLQARVQYRQYIWDLLTCTDYYQENEIISSIDYLVYCIRMTEELLDIPYLPN